MSGDQDKVLPAGWGKLVLMLEKHQIESLLPCTILWLKVCLSVLTFVF